MILFYLILAAVLVATGAALWQKYGAKAEADKLLLEQKYTGVKNDVKKVETDLRSM